VSGLAIVDAPPGSVGEVLASRFEVRGLDVVRAGGEKAIAAARAAGAVDVLVTDPHLHDATTATRLGPQAARTLLEEGFERPVALTLALWPYLVRTKGRVITVTGPLGVLASTHATGASAPEHALVSWSRAFSAAAGRQHVQVLTAHAEVRDPSRTAAVAEAVLHALDQGRHECWAPASLRARAVVQALLPGTLGRRAAAAR
jgi:hypothetical protein